MHVLIPEFCDVINAAQRIKKYVNKTPVMTSRTLNSMFRTDLYFKCENFQRGGAFKFRGAANAVLALAEDEAMKGVGTHSSGNHAAAVCQAAKIRGIEAHIVMPRSAPEVKKKAVRDYGGKITFCENTLMSRESTMDEILGKTGATFIPSYNHFDVIAGQGTAAKELIEEIDDLDFLLAPIGGGGLVSGMAIAARGLAPRAKVIAVEPKNADDAYRSFRSGNIMPPLKPNTIADALLTSLGALTFAVIREKVDGIVTVSEKAIIKAMRLIWERMKIIIEPSAAVPLAALMEEKINIRHRKAGIILSGGNVDLVSLPFK